MTTLTYIQTLYRYNAWANEVILNTAAQLNDDQYRASEGASFDSVHHTLVHTMSAQWIWLSRWTGTSPKTMLLPADFADLSAVRVRWADLEADTQAFVANLSPTQLNSDLAFTATEGTLYQIPLWQLMMHQANHATQHRSEIAMILTRQGYSPGELDLVYYLRRG